MTQPNSPGSSFKVTPEEVNSAATNTENAANEITSELGALRQYVVNLEGSWQGIASNTFQTLMVDYDTFSKMLIQSLHDISSGLRGNYVNYSSSEESNIGNLKAVNGSIPGAGFS